MSRCRIFGLPNDTAGLKVEDEQQDQRPTDAAAGTDVLAMQADKTLAEAVIRGYGTEIFANMPELRKRPGRIMSGRIILTPGMDIGAGAGEQTFFVYRNGGSKDIKVTAGGDTSPQQLKDGTVIVLDAGGKITFAAKEGCDDTLQLLKVVVRAR